VQADREAILSILPRYPPVYWAPDLPQRDTRQRLDDCFEPRRPLISLRTASRLIQRSSHGHAGGNSCQRYSTEEEPILEEPCSGDNRTDYRQFFSISHDILSEVALSSY